ncbi:Homeodomain-like domain protein [uncultured archaeon]|nr:Homeodomain-like domain protein [uncultured archaeon]
MIPCELVVTKLLPTIRRQAVSRMLKEGKSQREIAKELGLTEAAISYYVSKKRGGPSSKRMEQIIAKSMDKHYDAGKSFSENVCVICKGLRSSRQMCQIHLAIRPIRPDKSVCDVCISTKCK